MLRRGGGWGSSIENGLKGAGTSYNILEISVRSGRKIDKDDQMEGKALMMKALRKGMERWI